MKMSTMKIRELIDMAIGFPESGHVNFSALHFLLICIAEKLKITDETVDYHHNELETVCCCNELRNYEILRKTRLIGGTNPIEETANADTLEQEASGNLDVANEDQMNENDLNIDSIDQMEDVNVDSVYKAEDGALSPQTSASQLSIHRLKERVNKIEMSLQNIAVPKVILSGISVMKDQIEFVMEQILLLTFLTLSKKPEPKQIQQLYYMAQTLIEIKKDNIYIEGFKQIQLPAVPSLDWQSSGLQLNEDLSENDTLEAQSNDTIEGHIAHQGDLEGHLCYSPAKLLDQLMEQKSEICLLTNKVNELTSRLLQQESTRTLSLIQDIQEQLRDVKLIAVTLKETQSRMELRLTSDQTTLDALKANIEDIFEKKVDNNTFEIQLASKVDFSQLQRKVSLDQIMELQCRIDKKFCEMQRRNNESEKKCSDIIENMKNSLGFSANDDVLKKFKENISKDIQSLHEMLKSYNDATNDECAAAGARVKVLRDLACLSCDTNCVMRKIEKGKVAKLPSAHASSIISPLITYELSSIRKSGIMGYYRKEEFPHAPNAWLTNQSSGPADLKHCVPRHAGGEHTVNSAKERVQKTMINRK